MMKQSTLQRRLTMAISRLIVDEWRLLSVRTINSGNMVSERAVAFQLGWYLRPLIDRKWDIDCEYNRSGTRHHADVKRDSSSRSRLPDLIIHRRGERGPDNNLLILELKTNQRSQTHQGGDFNSIKDLRHKYEYQHGVLLDLQISHHNSQTILSPQWSWVNMTSESELRPVYSQETDLLALVERGKEEERHRYRSC